jgi:formylglycine-generating enzyme required for sulfatase activity
MGSPPDERTCQADEQPQRVVTLTRPFWMGRFAVTQQQYDSRPYPNASEFHGPHRPVDHVTWTEAVAFCAALGELPEEKAAGRTYRLPTEAEWEHACRAGSFTAFHTGPTHSMELMNCQVRFTSSEQPRVLLNRTADVGSYPPNGFGLYEMHGNVWEWCADWYTRWREDDAVTDPTGPDTGSSRVARGGCWEAVGSYCRAAKRLEKTPLVRSNHIGFRVVLEMKT